MNNLRAQTNKPIFISYSRVDTPFTRQVRADLEALGFTLWRDREDMPIGADWWQSIKEAIDGCDTLVLCMSPDALRSANVTDEWQYAREIGKRVMPVVAEAVDFSTVPRWMAAKDWADFRPGSKEAETSWARFINQLNMPYEPRKVPFMVDSLTTNFVARPTETEPLITTLIDPGRKPGTLIAALRGAGGYGKTTLARAIAHDRRVRGAFDDGILWVTLGEKATEQDLIDKLLDLTVKLIGSRPPVATLTAATDELRKAISDRYVLLIIDDVWQSAHIQPFLPGAKHAAFLITTRNNGVLPAETIRQSVDAMTPAEAFDLLIYKLFTHHAPLSAVETDKLRTLADRLGRWPLLLILANKILFNQIGYGASLIEALDFVAESLTVGGFDELNDPNNPDQRHSAVSATLGVSLKFLNEVQAGRFQQLAIFPEDSEIPLITLEKLWGVSRLEVQKCCQRYADLSLLLTYDLSRRVIQLHDVVRTYLRDSNRADLGQWHDRFLGAYPIPLNADQKDWASLPPDEPYLWRTLIYHLIGADHDDAVRALLGSIRWLRAKLNATDVGALLIDFDEAALTDDVLHLIQSALTLSAHVLAIDKTQLDSQLTGRLFTHRENPEIAVLLAQLTLTFEPLNATHMQAGGALIRILSGHTERVSGAIELIGDRDAGRLISWTGRTVQVWDMDGAPIRTLDGHKGRIRVVIARPEGRILTWADDGHIRLWNSDGTLFDTSTERIWHVYGASELPDRRILFWTERTFHFWESAHGTVSTVQVIDQGRADQISGVLVLRDGRIVSWTAADHDLRLWSADGQLIKSLSGHSAPIKGMIERHDGRLLSWALDKSIRLWNADGSPIEGAFADLQALPQSIRGILELSNGRLLVWEDHGRRLRLADADGKLRRTLTGHTADVSGALVLSDGRLLSWATNGTLWLWAADGLRIRMLSGHTQELSGALALHDGRLLSWSADHTLRLWDSQAGDGGGAEHNISMQPIKGMLALRNGRLAWWSGTAIRIWESDGTLYQRLQGHLKDVRGIVELSDGRLFSWAGDHILYLWQPDGTPIRAVEAPAEDVAGARQLNADRLAAWLGNGDIQLWDNAGDPIRTLHGHIGTLLGIWALDDNRLLSSASDGTLRFWTADGQPLQVIQGHQGTVSGLLRLRDGHLLSWGTDNLLKLWTTDGVLLHTLEGHTGYVWGALQLTDGRLLSWADGLQLRLWKADGNLIRVLDGHTGKVRGAFELTDGQMLSWSDDNTLRLWDSTGQPMRVITGHRDAIRNALRLADGRFLSWAKDSTLRLWSPTGQPLAVFTTDAPIMRCVILADQPIIAASDEQGRVLLLRLPDLTP